MFVHVKPAGGSLEQIFHHRFLVMHAYQRGMQLVYNPYKPAVPNLEVGTRYGVVNHVVPGCE